MCRYYFVTDLLVVAFVVSIKKVTARFYMHVCMHLENSLHNKTTRPPSPSSRTTRKIEKGIKKKPEEKEK